MSKWSGRTLTSEGTQETASGTTTIVRNVKEVYTLSADGKTLTIDVTSHDRRRDADQRARLHPPGQRRRLRELADTL